MSAGTGAPRLSVVVPAYGEAQRIGHTVTRLRDALAPLGGGGEAEIVVVDDGSGDATAEMAAAAGARVITFRRNRGKGAAVRAGLLSAAGATLAFTDADLSYPPAQLLGLMAEVEAGWDVVVGSRRHIDTRTLVRAGRLREVSGRVFNLATRAVLAGGYGDTQCGLKAFSGPAGRLLARSGRIDGFAFDVELLFLAERLGMRVREVPVELDSARGSTVRMGPDAVGMVADLIRLRRWSADGTYDRIER